MYMYILFSFAEINEEKSKPKYCQAQQDRVKYNFEIYLLLHSHLYSCWEKKCSEHFDSMSRNRFRRDYWSRDFRSRKEYLRNAITIENAKQQSAGH